MSLINPETKQTYTEIELLKMISEDAGRLYNIEQWLSEEGETVSIYSRASGIEMRTFETVQLLHQFKTLAWIIIILLGCNLVTLILFLVR